jgi:RNA methyltransferase, TrmH family
VITSPSNPLVKDLVRLRSARHRREQGRFLIEGRREVSRAMEAGIAIESVVVCPDLAPDAMPAGIRLIEMAEAPFRKISGRQNPDGILAVAPLLPTGLERIWFPDPTLVLWLEGIEKPGNLGAMLRTADGVGVDAVVVSDPATDVHNPHVVRSSQGALFTVPVAVTTTGAALSRFSAEAIRVVALTPDAPTTIWEADLTGSVAVAIGAEDRGLSDEVLDVADAHCLIPMRGTVDSLNASVAAAVVLYEALRRRQPS